MDVRPADSENPTDCQLIDVLQRPPDDDSRRAAAGELYRRYGGGLFAHCAVCYGPQLPPGADLQSIVDDAFIGFLNAIDRFDPSIAPCEAEVPKLIRCWLKKQAEWVMKRSARETIANRIVLESQFASAVDDGFVKRATAAVRKHRRGRPHLKALRNLRHVLHQLPEKAKHVLLESFRYHDPQTGQCTIPPDIQADLCNKWGFASANSLLKYRQRQFDKLVLLLTQHADVA